MCSNHYTSWPPFPTERARKEIHQRQFVPDIKRGLLSPKIEKKAWEQFVCCKLISTFLKWRGIFNFQWYGNWYHHIMAFCIRINHFAMILKFLLIFTLFYADPFLNVGSLHGCNIKLVTLNLWKKIQRCLIRTCIPAPGGGGLSIVSVLKSLMSLCNRYTYLAISFLSSHFESDLYLAIPAGGSLVLLFLVLSCIWNVCCIIPPTWIWSFDLIYSVLFN